MTRSNGVQLLAFYILGECDGTEKRVTGFEFSGSSSASVGVMRVDESHASCRKATISLPILAPRFLFDSSNDSIARLILTTTSILLMGGRTIAFRRPGVLITVRGIPHDRVLLQSSNLRRPTYSRATKSELALRKLQGSLD